MLTIGCHLSMAKGFTHMAKTSLWMKANTFQFFSRNPRGSKLKKLDPQDLEEFQKIRKEKKLGPLMAHAPYTMNLAGEKQQVYDFAKTVLQEDLKRMDEIGIEYFNLHPGSHVGQGLEIAISKIAQAINETQKEINQTTILLETMSGKGTEVGFQFEQLKQIIQRIEKSNKIGICMDLCHVFASGYDITNHLEKVLNEFDRTIGIERLKAIHLNDSKMPLGSKKDRHEPIGMGQIGEEAILKIMQHPKLKQLPYYLETPLDEEGHKKEIQKIRNYRFTINMSQ